MAEKKMKTEEKEDIKEAQIEEIDLNEVAEEKVNSKEDEGESDEEAKRREKMKDGRVGIAYIYSSPNNTIVHITDLAGNTISRISGGMVTKHSRLKSNPTIAMFVAKRAAERANDLGFTRLYVRTRGKTGENHGPGVNSAVKSLSKSFELISILDTMRVPRGGPKKKGGRRGRRV